MDPKDVNVPVVGGHAGVTILPILSQVRSSLLTVLCFSFLLSIMYYGMCQKQAIVPSDMHKWPVPSTPYSVLLFMICTIGMWVLNNGYVR
jgi:O-antigen/teichoic acid export membrane protein